MKSSSRCLYNSSFRTFLGTDPRSILGGLGMVICVPTGNGNKTVGGFPEDATRLPEFYNGTYEYLRSLGLAEL